MCLKLGWFLVGQSLSLCSIFTPPFLVDRINFGSEVLWVGWCPYHFTAVPVWLLEVAFSGFIFPLLWVSAKVIPTDFWGPPPSQVFGMSLWCLQPPTLRVADFCLFSWPSGPFCLPTWSWTLYHLIHLPIPSLTQFPPSVYLLWLFYSLF